MTHFMVSVILPRLDAEDMNEEIDRLLAPYSENLEVPEYDRPCWCLNRDARNYGADMANKLVGTWDAQREAFHDTIEYSALSNQRGAAFRAENWEQYHVYDNRIDAAWKIFIADFDQQWEETKRDYTENHPRYSLPKIDCDECHGKGTYRSQYNPASKWDWYRIGGRFDGMVTDNQQQSERGFNFDAKHETLANNSVPVQELLDRHAETGEVFRSYAIVTPDGEWIERGQIGWWGMSSGDLPQNVWEDQLLTIYRKYAAFDIVGIDCHI